MKNKKILPVVIAFITIYCLHFIVFPMTARRHFPSSNETAGLYFGSFIILIILLEFKVCNNIIAWLIGDIVYFALVFLYHGKGYYGIGLAGVNLDGASRYYDFEFAAIYKKR